MRFAEPNGGMEPIGNRIITLPQDQTGHQARPHSGFNRVRASRRHQERLGIGQDGRSGQNRHVQHLSR